jgi:hypothetical protein
MSKNVVALIPQKEIALINTYLSGESDYYFSDYYEEHEIPGDAAATQLEIAVAQVLLAPIQGSLPQCVVYNGAGKLERNRKSIQRHPESTSFKLHSELICCINWADSAPGLSWPESYHIVSIPWQEKYIVTCSRDGAEAFSCADQCLGWGDIKEGKLAVAKREIKAWWENCRDEYEQECWVSLFDEGLIDRFVAQWWAGEVWPESLIEPKDWDEEEK